MKYDKNNFKNLAECFINISCLNLFYSEVSEGVKSSVQALFLLTSSFGAGLSALFTVVFDRYITTDLNDGHLEYLFICLAVTTFTAFMIFLLVSRKFIYRADRLNDKKLEIELK